MTIIRTNAITVPADAGDELAHRFAARAGAVDGAEGFEGGTFESYVDDLDWWEHAELQGFLDGGGIGLIVHYDEVDCDGVYANYQASYGPALSFICEDPALNGYKHYN